MDGNPLCSWQLKSIETSSLISFHHIYFSAAAPIHMEICVYSAYMCICIFFLPVCGVQSHALEIFFLTDLRLQAL